MAIANIDNKFVQDRAPEGGAGGIGDVWTMLRQRLNNDREIFELVKSKCASLERFVDITVAGEVKVTAQELRAMFKKAWATFFECMQDWFKHDDPGRLQIVGGAPSSSSAVQCFLEEELSERGIQASFPVHTEPT